MFKKMLAIPLLCISMVFFVQCTKELSDPDTNNYNVKKGPGSGGGGGEGEESATNNLSFPVFAMDSYTITPIPETAFSFEVPYNGPNTGLSAEELAALAGYTWYAQKVPGNKWQAEFSQKNEESEVTFVDWGDALESVNPKIGRPTRIELTLYKDISDEPMTAFTMALLANPSSSEESQGTNTETYDGNWATFVSAKPQLVVQFLSVPTAELEWDGTKWTGDGVGAPVTGFGFAPELNVGGKYIFGASKGGWKPTVAGVYRITFYIPVQGCNILLTDDTGIGNYPGNTNDGLWAVPTEGGAGKPVVDWENNLTYVDVTVTGGGGGGGKGGGGKGGGDKGGGSKGGGKKP